MASVCFTGRGKISGPTLSGFDTSKFHDRSWWKDLAISNGWAVFDKVGQGCLYLVASRTDTSKAVSARKFGTTVIDYDDFYAMFKEGKPGAIKTPNERFVPIDMSAMEDMPGWGSF